MKMKHKNTSTCIISIQNMK